MSYDLSLDKKTIGFLALGSTLLVILVFIAGLVIGVHWNATPSAPSTAVVGGEVRQPGLESETEEPAPAKGASVEEKALNHEVLSPIETDNGAPAKPTDALSPAGRERDEPKTTAPLAGIDPKVIQKMEPDAPEAAAADPEEELAVKRTTFSLQVGAFSEEKDANKLVERMEDKGYTPTIFVANDADNQLWYVVRIGSYDSKAEAMQAASILFEQEKIKAVVRPTGSL